MNTPIYDFVQKYAKGGNARLHMPGHKGVPFLGCEPLDITEIGGADVLSDASGIIAESEANAAKLFGTAATYYSAEGSSQCIKAMLALAAEGKPRARVLAARNVHRAFLHAAALLDLRVDWLYPEEGDAHLCACRITPERLAEALGGAGELPAAVYLTSPDYLGNLADIAALSAVCRRWRVPLLVDNAHGAYLRFLSPSLHPISLGASLCCDSAHKTLPALTGGAYLHVAKGAERYLASARERLALFSSSSPSYLILASLDLCNRYLSDRYGERLAETTRRVSRLREEISDLGYTLLPSEPLKLTLRADGRPLAAHLCREGIEPELADRDFLVLMPTAETRESELARLVSALGSYAGDRSASVLPPSPATGERVMSIREATLAASERVPLRAALGRVASGGALACPPAVPIVLSGERITEDALRLLRHYGYDSVPVVREKQSVF